jgi:starvation-inducible outer membrane lipoprotein
MPRSITTCALLVPLAIALAACANAPEGIRDARVHSTPSWNKYYVAGSRIPRTLDAQGQPLTGSHIVTITDEELTNSSGVLLGDKLNGGYSR